MLLHVDLLPSIKTDAGNAKHYGKVDYRYDYEHHYWVAERTVLETIPFTQFAVLFDGEEVDVTNIAVLQLASMTVVVAVNACPISVGYGAEERTDEADDIVHFTFLQKGIVAAVMLNDENTDEEESVDCAQAQREPDGIVNTEIHSDPEGHERSETAEQLANSTASTGFLVLSYDGLPVLEALVDVFLAISDGILHVLIF